MPKTNAQKKAEKLKADKAKGIKNLTLPLGPADQQKLEGLVTRYGFDDWREMLTRLIQEVHAATWPEALAVPRHDYAPSQKLLRRLEREGKIQASRMDKDDENDT